MEQVHAPVACALSGKVVDISNCDAVPHTLLIQLLQVRQFSCPKCRQAQALHAELPQVARWLGISEFDQANFARDAPQASCFTPGPGMTT